MEQSERVERGGVGEVRGGGVGVSGAVRGGGVGWGWSGQREWCGVGEKFRGVY